MSYIKDRYSHCNKEHLTSFDSLYLTLTSKLWGMYGGHFTEKWGQFANEIIVLPVEEFSQLSYVFK